MTVWRCRPPQRRQPRLAGVSRRPRARTKIDPCLVLERLSRSGERPRLFCGDRIVSAAETADRARQCGAAAPGQPTAPGATPRGNGGTQALAVGDGRAVQGLLGQTIMRAAAARWDWPRRWCRRGRRSARISATACCPVGARTDRRRVAAKLSDRAGQGRDPCPAQRAASRCDEDGLPAAEQSPRGSTHRLADHEHRDGTARDDAGGERQHASPWIVS